MNAKGDSDATGTAWPEVHFLGPQHPVLDWLADKLLYRVERNEAIAIPCDVDAPTVLVSGVWSNKLGEPIAEAWLAATVEGGLATFSDLFETLARAGVADAMVNPAWEGDPGDVEKDLATVVNAVAANLADTMEGPLALVHERLSETRKRLERWRDRGTLVRRGHELRDESPSTAGRHRAGHPPDRGPDHEPHAGVITLNPRHRRVGSEELKWSGAHKT